jgi:hypothetical protein
MLKKMHLEREVIENMINLLKTKEYHDELLIFKSNAAGMSVFPWQVWRVVASNVKYWDFISLKLLRFAFLDLVKGLIKGILPPFVFMKLKRLRYSIR